MIYFTKQPPYNHHTDKILKKNLHQKNLILEMIIRIAWSL